MNKVTLGFMALLIGTSGLFFTADSATFTTQRVVAGLEAPLFVTSPPGDFDRLFILEQMNARILILQNGQLLPTPFLDIKPIVGTTELEEGLISLAFHPQYASNGYFFINYTTGASLTVIARYTVSSNPNVADPNSEVVLLSFSQPVPIHNADMMAFGPDGYLYVTTGDGGTFHDELNLAQNGNRFYGKVLRLDVDGGFPYAIPPDNPFVGEPLVRDEIWAMGLRNPWRASFDRLTGDFYIADVGAEDFEEINFQPAGSPGGQNYGWNNYEGNTQVGYGPISPVVPQVTAPFFTYPHTPVYGAAIGGYVYRGSALPQLQGRYFFADYNAGQIWSFIEQGGSLTGLQNFTMDLVPPLYDINNINSFGEDAAGELYVVDGVEGEIFKVVPLTDEILVTADAVNPPIVIPPGGGSFTFTLNLANPGGAPQNFDLWTDALGVDTNSPSDPLIVRSGLTLPPGASVTRSVVQPIAGTTPAQDYWYRVFAGVYPNQVFDYDTLTFTMSGAELAGIPPGGWEPLDLLNEPEAAAAPAAGVSIRPNPFNPVATLAYTLPQAGQVSLAVYDLQGRRVAELVNGWREAGAHQVTFDGSALASGLYLYRLQAQEVHTAGKMMLVK
ncbi:MAG: T9SS C-terminal target domain-containing protein [Candidatus Zixiibacteriota bacterium]|nr:MAG: T9SS C-terminal target domain-containing protein [candidate division Zixibacteria bacterium]